jgi:hypothetical protein
VMILRLLENWVEWRQVHWRLGEYCANLQHPLDMNQESAHRLCDPRYPRCSAHAIFLRTFWPIQGCRRYLTLQIVAGSWLANESAWFFCKLWNIPRKKNRKESLLVGATGRHPNFASLALIGCDQRKLIPQHEVSGRTRLYRFGF